MLNQLRFLKKLLQAKKNLLFCIDDPVGVKLLTRLRLQFSHLNEQKFRYGFSDTINPMRAYRAEVQITEQYLLRCHFYSTQRLELLENLEKIDPNFLSLSAKNQVYILLYGSQTKNSKSLNHEILKNVIFYLKTTTRIDGPLMNF